MKNYNNRQFIFVGFFYALVRGFAFRQLKPFCVYLNEGYFIFGGFNKVNKGQAILINIYYKNGLMNIPKKKLKRQWILPWDIGTN